MELSYCPSCKSTNIDLSPLIDQAAFGFRPLLKCNACGFESLAFPQKEARQ